MQGWCRQALPPHRLYIQHTRGCSSQLDMWQAAGGRAGQSPKASMLP